MTAGSKMNWCGACFHAIVPAGGRTQGWGHFSDDDWSGQSCVCANLLAPCSPRPRGEWKVTGATGGHTVTLASGRELVYGPGFLYTRGVDSGA